jgi:cytidylate kinase
MTGKAKDEAKRICQVSLDDEEYAHLEHIATHRKITVEQWIAEIIRRDMADYRRRSASIQRALEEAVCHNFPACDIEEMLKEIESGYDSL